jgi:indolepyruvate ferredoxin oxidoreductase beta subunit
MNNASDWSFTERPLTLAILAMGGQGGGVLCDWIVNVAEREGWIAQSTSVPGVAQRTGSTIYYIEMLKAQGDKLPVLSLMPTAGDVDVVLASEFVEAGRSMLRGLVTPDRTTLIASTHRVYAVTEKQQPGDGTADPVLVSEAVGVTAKRAILFDMQTLAEKNGSVISATMMGALAASKTLPFGRAAFEAAIAEGGKGVSASLKAFAAAYDRTENPPKPAPPIAKVGLPLPPLSVGRRELDQLLDRIRAMVPFSAQAIAFAGLKKVIDFQDIAYGHEYLDRLGVFCGMEPSAQLHEHSHQLSSAAAKHIAVAMCYDDVIRIADLKTRASRFSRIDKEVGKKSDQLLYMTEFMHPRLEEVLGTLPSGLGKWIEGSPRLAGRLDRMINRGRRVRTGTLFWFLGLYAVSYLRPVRRRLLRHERELVGLESWLALAKDIAARDYDLAVEVLICRRLVKGYSDTHERGTSKFLRVMAAVPDLVGKPDSAGWLRRLRTAALVDENGDALKGALKTLESAFETTAA